MERTPCIVGNILQPESLNAVFKTYKPIAVIHLASLINARESTKNPLQYYQNNLVGTIFLLEAMVAHKTSLLVFSSSAAVYGNPFYIPILENHPLQPTSIYGKSKKMAEKIVTDFLMAYGIRSIILRYFNVAGADFSGEMGEAHSQENHLIPLAILTALGEKKSLKVFGMDHPTPDGTPIRDYVHVCDLAEAHLLSLEWLLGGGESATFNLGNGEGYSVLNIIQMVEKKFSKPLSLEFLSRHPADPPILVADISRAKQSLNWKPQFSDLETIISSALNWHKK